MRYIEVYVVSIIANCEPTSVCCVESGKAYYRYTHFECSCLEKFYEFEICGQ